MNKEHLDLLRAFEYNGGINDIRQNMKSKNLSICAYLKNYQHAQYRVLTLSIYKDLPINLHNMFKSWKYYTGSTTYPVPAPIDYANPDVLRGISKRDIACKAFHDPNMRKWEGFYGDYRESLFIHMINEVKKYLAAYKEAQKALGITKENNDD